MNILIANNTVIPVSKYGGTERAIWYLGKELAKKGHRVTYLVKKGSSCDFAKVIFWDENQPLSRQIHADIDVVHLLFSPDEPLEKPYIVTIQGNSNDKRPLDRNTVFVSRNHAERYGSGSFVYNGMDWDDYGKVYLSHKKNYFHFLGNAAWRVKNVAGAIALVNHIEGARLKVLGGYRLNFNMGFRFTLSPKIRFYGMVGGEEKLELLRYSKGLIFPVRWHEPFGIALTESMYFGCPVFGTPYGSLPEIVTKEVGFLSNKLPELREAIAHLEDFSPKKCHERAVEHFNSRKMADAYEKKYDTVLKGHYLNERNPVLKEIQTQKFLDWTE